MEEENKVEIVVDNNEPNSKKACKPGVIIAIIGTIGGVVAGCAYALKERKNIRKNKKAKKTEKDIARLEAMGYTVIDPIENLTTAEPDSKD